MKAIKIEIDRTILAGIKIGLAIIIITLLAACQSVSSGIPYIPKKPEVLVVNLSNIKDQDIDKVINIWHDKVCNPIVTSKEIKLVSLLDAFKATLGALSKIVKIQ